jgi:hypothetical protein
MTHSVSPNAYSSHAQVSIDRSPLLLSPSARAPPPPLAGVPKLPHTARSPTLSSAASTRASSATNPSRAASRMTGAGLARSSANTHGQEPRLPCSPARACIGSTTRGAPSTSPAGVHLTIWVHARGSRRKPPGRRVPGALLASRPPPPHGSV